MFLIHDLVFKHLQGTHEIHNYDRYMYIYIHIHPHIHVYIMYTCTSYLMAQGVYQIYKTETNGEVYIFEIYPECCDITCIYISPPKAKHQNITNTVVRKNLF